MTTDKKYELPKYFDEMLTEDSAKALPMYRGIAKCSGDSEHRITFINGFQPLGDGELRLFLRDGEPLVVSKAWVDYWKPAVGHYIGYHEKFGHTFSAEPSLFDEMYMEVTTAEQKMIAAQINCATLHKHWHETLDMEHGTRVTVFRQEQAAKRYLEMREHAAAITTHQGN